MFGLGVHTEEPQASERHSRVADRERHTRVGSKLSPRKPMVDPKLWFLIQKLACFMTTRAGAGSARDNLRHGTVEQL
jgi:hypothetical protein